MTDVAARFRRITNTYQHSADIIAPRPDFEIVHDNGNVYVQTTDRRNSTEVLEYIQNTNGGKWMVAVWVTLEDGVTTVKDNPVENEFGFMWKVVRG